MFSFSTLKPSFTPKTLISTPSTITTTYSYPSHQIQNLSFPSRLQIPETPFQQQRIPPPNNHQNTHSTDLSPYTPSPLKIAIIGFGNFGQFLAKTFISQSHTVYAYSRSNRLAIAQTINAHFFSDLHDLCEHHPDVILISTSIISTESVLKSLPLQSLKRNTLFVDVLSVKEFPKNIFLQYLPSHFDVLCTHPMFGPESGKNGWRDLPFVFDKVRIGDEGCRVDRVECFLDIFRNEGCRMVEMSCAEHDRYAAGSQFITHTVGRILEKMSLDSTPINTRGYETVLDLVENTASDSFDLYYGLFMYNKNAMEELERLDLAFEALKKELFGRLHEVLRKQLFGKAEEEEEGGAERRVLGKLHKNGIQLFGDGKN